MYTILIVDDEKIERNGIKFLLKKQAEPFEIYEAPNGKAALEQLCSMRNQGKKIDILLTDVKMPFMDGIELIGAAKEEGFTLKTIIFSGYNEFDYAKQAIHIGVTDYLLKPITAAKLLEAVKKVADVIEKEREDARLMDKYRLEMAENTVLERQRLLRDLVTGRVNFKEALERGEQVGMDLSASFYQLMLFKLMPMGSAVAYSDRVVSCQEAIEERMGRGVGLRSHGGV